MAEAVKVIVRCRPLNQREKDLKCENIIEMDDKTGQCRLGKPGEKTQPPKSFTFDGVFNVDSITESLYADICFPLVDGAVEGYNGTVFAYGQTGCGKSFTMQGITDPPTQRGIIPRAFEHVFESIQILAEDTKYLVNASYLEIYNEDIRDLLVNNHRSKLEVKEHPDRGVYVKDLSMTTCHSVEDMEKVMEKGGHNRSVGSTLMNADSSRSHSIFTIYIETCERGADGEDHIKAGKLHLVDLAGSERQAKTGATGDRLKEATKINLSLSALGNVISALVDGKSKHIPYRDSKLTRLLQDSLGGNTKTLMVACISPADNNYEETLSTLRYANRAKNIKNKPKINEDPKDALLRQYQDEITMLKQLLTGQLQMSPEVVAQLGLTGNAVTASPLKQVTSGQTFISSDGGRAGNEVETDRIKSEYEEKLASLQQKYEEEHSDKMKLAEEIDSLQRDLSGKLRSASQSEVPVENRSSKTVAAVAGEEAIMKPRIASIPSKPDDKQTFLLGDQPLPDIPTVDAPGTSADFEQPLDSKTTTLSPNSIQEEAAKKLSLLQQHLVKSEPQIDKDELATKHKERRNQYKQRQQQKIKDIKKWEGEGIMAKVYDNLQDEIKDKHEQLEKLGDELIAANADIADIQSEFQTERTDYLDTIRKLEQQLMLQNQILEKIQPTIRRDCNYYNLAKIQSSSEFNEETQSWDIPDLLIERTSLPKEGLGTKRLSMINQEIVKNQPSPPNAENHHNMMDVDGDDAIDRYALHIQNSSNEDFSSNYFKPKRVDKILANNVVGGSSMMGESNLFKLPSPSSSKSPLRGEPEPLTRRPLKLEALPPSAFDKKKKKSKSRDG